jgi:predicted small metal-binding protein
LVLEKVIECDCGWSFRGSERDLVAACAAHALDVHGMELSPEQILAARPVDDAEDTAGR